MSFWRAFSYIFEIIEVYPELPYTEKAEKIAKNNQKHITYLPIEQLGIKYLQGLRTIRNGFF